MELQGAKLADAPEVTLVPPVQLGPVESVTVPEEIPITSVSTTELSSAKLTAAEEGKKLLKLAGKASKHDHVDGEAYWRPNRLAAPGVFVVAGTGLIVEAVTYSDGYHLPTLVGSAALFVASAIPPMHASFNAISEYTHNGSNYRLQCLRVSKDAVGVPEGKVAVAVHPPGYKSNVELEPPEVTRYRLAHALDVVAAAREQDEKNTIGSVIIPGSIARKAGLPYTGDRGYTETINALHDYKTKNSYASSETAVVISAEMAAAVAEMVRADKDILLDRVFSELAQRFPGKREALHENNASVVAVLHGLLERTAAEASGIRTKQRDISRVVAYKQNDDGSKTAVHIDGWNGHIRTDSEDVVTHVNRQNPFNPHIQQRGSKTLGEVSNGDLRTLTGGPEAMIDIVGKLNDGRYDKMQLLRVALELLEVRQDEEPQKRGQPHNDHPAGYKRAIIRAEKKQDGPMKEVGKFLGRTALAVGIVVGGRWVEREVRQAVNYELPEVPSISQDGSMRKQLWRVEENGLQVYSPYWSQYTYDQYNHDEGWSSLPESPNEQSAELKLPAMLPDKSVPHRSVRTIIDKPVLSLPIQEGTQLAAIRAEGAGRKPLTVHTVRFADGEIKAVVDIAQYTAYSLSYDLVAAEADKPNIAPQGPLRVADVDKLRPLQPEDGPTANPEDIPNYIRDTYTYDNSRKLKRSLGEDAFQEFVDHLHTAKRCQCGQCNTLAAIKLAKVHPALQAEMTYGYLHNLDNVKDGQSYFSRTVFHAWMNFDGIKDATAARLDAHSFPSQAESTDKLNQTWAGDWKKYNLDRPEDKNPWKDVIPPLAAVVLLGAAGLEWRKRYMRYATGNYLSWAGAQTAAHDIDRDDALRLLSWEAYAKQTNRVPDIQGVQGASVKEENIPIETLQAVAKGNFRADGQLTKEQQRGLRNTAKSVLRDRKLQRNSR